MLHMTHFVRIVLATLAPALQASAAATEVVADGDYAGWIYFDAGFDMPLRMHIERKGEGELAASLDLPVYDEGGVAASVVEPTDEGLRIEFPDAVDFKVELVLQVDGTALVGDATWTGDERTLEADIYLHRSAVPLPWVPMADIPDFSGVYPLAPGRTIIITRRPWGEPLYTDPLTGRSGCLFARSPRDYFAGRLNYVPDQVTATVKLEVNDAGELAHLTWRDEGGEPMTARRVEFVTETLAFNSGDAALHGAITRLPGDRPRPGIVVIGGSDWSTASGLGRFTRTFAAFGFTVLSFDKRGHGGSGGERDAAFETIADDLVAAVETLAARADVIDDQVGLFGYSRAGWHIPLAASRSDAIDFALVFVPPAVSPAVQETTRRLADLRESGVTDAEDIELARTYLDAIWEFAKTGENGEAYLELRAEIENLGWLEILAGPATLDEDEWRWARLNMHYDPVPALSSVTCPILAVFGGADANVTVEQNVPVMRRAFEAAGNDAARIEIIDGVNHGLRLVPPAGADIRHHNRLDDPAELWPMVYEWLAGHTELEFP